MIMAAIVPAVFALALANGANDNFKGVATLHGAGRLSYRAALALATLTTLLGSLSAILFGAVLVRRFSGRGLVPDAVAADPSFLLAAAIGAAATVWLATRLGFPVSTTHALTGALLGGGLLLAGTAGVRYAALASSFVMPLLLSPLMALLLAASIQLVVRRGQGMLGSEPLCVCTSGSLEAAAATPDAQSVQFTSAAPLHVDRLERCARDGSGVLLAVPPGRVIDALHVASAAVVGFARGMNDAPKLAALLVGAQALSTGTATAVLAGAMALGGIMAARRVARTLSFGITGMNAGEGLSANLVTASLVAFASPLGLPVSTTHVSCGALFGIGAANGEARWKMIGGIAGAWVITLPVAAALSAVAAAALTAVR